MAGMSATRYYDILTGAGELYMGPDEDNYAPVGYSAKSPVAEYNQATGRVTLQGIGAANVVWRSNLAWGSSTPDSSESSTASIYGEP